ncbi:MAG: DUF1295 domain-containing protein [Pseudomonadales bacterium]
MNFGLPLCIIFTTVWTVAIFSANDTLVSMLAVNAAVQIAFFTVVACIPFLRTGRMSYVDIAWPLGVALIGVQILLMGDGNALRKWLVAAIYLLIGLRMGLGALVMAKNTGIIFQREFPRYQYRRMTFEQSGTRHIRLHTLAEIMAQGFANLSVLALPGFMLAVNSSPVMSPWEIAGMCLWLLAYTLEMAADMQKLRFIKRNKRGVCNIGLWRYSRHPNYFAEWLVWTALVVAAMPSWLALQSSEAPFTWAVLGLGALGASAMLYTTLVYLTGAIPAEYYSQRKRPEYAEYQRTTNRFFPWFPKSHPSD